MHIKEIAAQLRCCSLKAKSLGKYPKNVKVNKLPMALITTATHIKVSLKPINTKQGRGKMPSHRICGEAKPPAFMQLM